MPFFRLRNVHPFRRWVVRIVKVGECYECQKQAKTIDLMRIDTHITTVRFWRDPTPTVEAESEWQLPLLPQLLSV